jgi:hypothetical protein
MKIKLNKIVGVVPSLKFLAEQTTQARTAFKLAKFLNAVSAELDIFENTRKKLFMQYKMPNEDQIAPENMDTFRDEMNALLDMEIEIPFEQISISELVGTTIPVSHMMNLDFMFKE